MRTTQCLSSSRSIPASFWRGGTSRGLIFRSSTLSPYSPSVRDSIIRTALGSPDPSGRQISGLGGGVSSLSKCCVIGLPREGLGGQLEFGRLPGVEWADKEDAEWDIVYRFCQVGVRDTGMDWSATCGNMLSAVAYSTLSTPLIPYTTLFTRSKSLPKPPSGKPLLFPIRILSASNGRIMNVRIPIDPVTLQVWDNPDDENGIEIAGVPGRGIPIELEMPLDDTGDSVGGLVTGNVVDSIDIDGVDVPISILTSGLPNIFLALSSLSQFPSSLLSTPLSTLNSHPNLHSTLESIRQKVSKKFNLPISEASPKICLVGTIPDGGFVSSGGGLIGKEEGDLLVRAVSGGDFHATIPGTTLGALNVGLGTPGSLISTLVNLSKSASEAEIVTIKAAHAAGIATSSVKFVKDEKTGNRIPKAVVMLRTAREIMRGEVLVPEKVFGEL